MKKYSGDYVNKFIEKYSEDFPGVSDDELKLIINSPFKAFSLQLKQGILEPFRIKYFGVFKIYENKFKTIKKNIIKKYKDGKLSEEYYQEVKKVFKNYERNNLPTESK